MARSVTSVTPVAVACRNVRVQQAPIPSTQEGDTHGIQSAASSQNLRILRAELWKENRAKLEFEEAQDELIRRLDEEDAALWELADASAKAVSCLETLNSQRQVVDWCREWVEQERVALMEFQPMVEQLRSRYEQTRTRETRSLIHTHLDASEDGQIDF